MKYEEHLPDQRLLLDVEGELSPPDEKLARVHLARCWKCRARRQELENAITGFVCAYQRKFETKLPPVAGPRAPLKAHLTQLWFIGPNGDGTPQLATCRAPGPGAARKHLSALKHEKAASFI